MNNKAIECMGDNGVCIAMSSYSPKIIITTTVHSKTNADKIRSIKDGDFVNNKENLTKEILK